MCDFSSSSVNVTSTEFTHYVKSRLVLTKMIQSIKIHLEWSQIQDMDAEIPLHIVNYTWRVLLFLQRKPCLRMWYWFFYYSSINKKLILRDLRFRQHISCFCTIFRICIASILAFSAGSGYRSDETDPNSIFCIANIVLLLKPQTQ